MTDCDSTIVVIDSILIHFKLRKNKYHCKSITWEQKKLTTLPSTIGTDANPLNATHPFTWKGCNFWVVAIWREYEILKNFFIVNEI